MVIQNMLPQEILLVAILIANIVIMFVTVWKFTKIALILMIGISTKERMTIFGNAMMIKNNYLFLSKHKH